MACRLKAIENVRLPFTADRTSGEAVLNDVIVKAGKQDARKGSGLLCGTLAACRTDVGQSGEDAIAPQHHSFLFLPLLRWLRQFPSPIIHYSTAGLPVS
jgi:hypothetical protein